MTTIPRHITESMTLKVKYYDLRSIIDRLLSKGATITSIAITGDRCYEIVFDAKTDAEEDVIWKEDYKRLLFMEKLIKTYPDLRKAVRAAMEHDDRSIEYHLNRFHEVLQGNSQSSRSTSEPRSVQP